MKFLFIFFPRIFNSAPFTIQRLCELILSPRIHYRRTDKFIRGLTKCVSVVTTIDNEGK
jgi:serine/threonine-protein phosphatase 4 regulatory subunit 2